LRAGDGSELYFTPVLMRHAADGTPGGHVMRPDWLAKERGRATPPTIKMWNGANIVESTWSC
jgi:hypothetical protein